MNFSDKIADGLMSLALRWTPANRQEIAQAMRGELAALEQGRLAWALGCLRAALVWRLAATAPFGLALVGTGLLFEVVEGIPLILIHGQAAPVVIYLYWLASPALACALLAAWKPQYAYVGAAGFFLLQIAITQAVLLYFQTTVPSIHIPSDHKWHILDAPPVVGWSAQMAWLVLGAWLGKRWSQRKAASPEASRRH